jgi:hypothetical protein
MSKHVASPRSTAFRIGWWTLFVATVLAVVNHAVLIFSIPREAVLFVGWTGLSLLAAILLYIPYRSGEPWAWYSMWIFIACFAVLLPLGADIGLYYLVAAGVMAVGQLLTRHSIFARV